MNSKPKYSARYAVGDHVRIKGHVKTTGTITHVDWAHNNDWLWYWAYEVEYDSPIHAPWPRQHSKYYRGTHSEEALEKIGGVSDET